MVIFDTDHLNCYEIMHEHNSIDILTQTENTVSSSKRLTFQHAESDNLWS